MFRAGQRQFTACLRILSGVLSAALFISLPVPQATMGPSVTLTAAPVTLTLPDAVPAAPQPLRPGALLYPRGWRHGPWIEAFRAHGRGWALQTTARSGLGRRPDRTPAVPAGRRSQRLPRVAPHVSPPPVAVAPAATCAVVECDPLTAIHWAATRWGASESELVAVARCESALNPQAYNASSGSSGLFQFLPATYWAYARLAGETRTYRVASAAANVAAWMFAHGFANQWTCA
jgi:Transglycosylase SLT domain